jgi:hypothetical protein
MTSNSNCLRWFNTSTDEPSIEKSHGFSTNQNRRTKAEKIKIVLDEHLKTSPDHRLLVLRITSVILFV